VYLWSLNRDAASPAGRQNQTVTSDRLTPISNKPVRLELIPDSPNRTGLDETFAV